ncbi:hypothetical protein ACJX0J_022134, partial [Zea mays]
QIGEHFIDENGLEKTKMKKTGGGGREGKKPHHGWTARSKIANQMNLYADFATTGVDHQHLAAAALPGLDPRPKGTQSAPTYILVFSQ